MAFKDPRMLLSVHFSLWKLKPPVTRLPWKSGKPPRKEGAAACWGPLGGPVGWKGPKVEQVGMFVCGFLLKWDRYVMCFFFFWFLHVFSWIYCMLMFVYGVFWSFLWMYGMLIFCFSFCGYGFAWIEIACVHVFDKHIVNINMQLRFIQIESPRYSTHSPLCVWQVFWFQRLRQTHIVELYIFLQPR